MILIVPPAEMNMSKGKREREGEEETNKRYIHK
jgi:hypothetical protein